MAEKVCLRCNRMRDRAFLCDGKCEWKHPFWTGYDGRIDGQDEYDNPYPSGDGWRNAWQHGWDTADKAMDE
jgi:hypothetical protein